MSSKAPQPNPNPGQDHVVSPPPPLPRESSASYWLRTGVRPTVSTPIGEVEIAGHLSVLNVKPGDVLFFRTSRSIPKEAAERLAESIRRAVPDLTCVLLTNDIDVFVGREVKGEDDEQRTEPQT